MNNIPEIDYIIKIIFNILSVDISLVKSESNTFTITGLNGVLDINNSFFTNLKEDSTYIKKENIPQKLTWFNNPYSKGDELPIIYGCNKYSNENNHIYCGLDIFASSFFMLSRWEELVLPKDKFGRCDENMMFVVKHNIYDRPIVNEYIELLKNMLNEIGIKCNDNNKFTPFITHDIDALFRYDFKNLIKNLAGDILHRKNFKEFLKTISNYKNYKLGRIKDPFDTFDELMDLSDKYGLKNSFYFMPTYKNEYDARYDIRDCRIRKIIDNILERGHNIGIHPSKNTFNNELQFFEEFNRLSNLHPFEGGRQHYLLYKIPESLRAFEKLSLKYDAGLGFAFRAGFRCGFCYSYNFFDVLERVELSITIKPLIVMETAVFVEGNSLEFMCNNIYRMIDIVRKFNGEFVFLWHNDNFNRVRGKNNWQYYEDIIDYIVKKTK